MKRETETRVEAGRGVGVGAWGVREGGETEDFDCHRY